VLDRPSGRLRAEQRLRRAIAAGDLAPGHRLVEADLVAMLGVSRGDVRLAMATLAADGLVERIPNRGARVRVVSTEEAIAITECRMALEGLIARKAAERVSAPQGEALRAHLGRMRRAVEAADHAAYSALISDLHRLLREVAEQPVAAGLVDRLQAQLVRHQFRLSLRPGRPRASLAELGALVDAVVDGDPDRAEAAAADHFRSVIALLGATADGGAVDIPDPRGHT
jgi:DNA-binding GntR family transcriptional regulator